MSYASLKEELIETDDAFRRLYEQHQAYKRRLKEIRLKTLLSQDDEIEIKKIKLRKLELKDRMEAMLIEHQRSAVASA